LREEGEEIEMIETPLAKTWAMVEGGVIVDARTVLLLHHLMLARSGAGAAGTG
jgi:hypothetical protein